MSLTLKSSKHCYVLIEDTDFFLLESKKIQIKLKSLVHSSLDASHFMNFVYQLCIIILSLIIIAMRANSVLTMCKRSYRCSPSVHSFYLHNNQKVGSIIIFILQMKLEAQRD